MNSLRTLLPVLAASAFLPISVCADNLPTTAAEQKALKLTAVLQDLMDGNKRYVAGKLTAPNVKEHIAASSTGQHPTGTILSCRDSRVAVEQIFDQGIGDIFVGRVAGNVENEHQLGSKEFAAEVAGVKDRNSKNAEFVQKVVVQNVRQTAADIRCRSEVLAAMEKAGDIKIGGAVYSLTDGKVTLLD